MRLKKMIVGLLGSIIAIGGFLEVATADLKFPMLVYRTGAYAPNGIPNADGFVDYYKMINARDGGIGGEKIYTQNVRQDIRLKLVLSVTKKQERCDGIPANVYWYHLSANT